MATIGADPTLAAVPAPNPALRRPSGFLTEVKWSETTGHGIVRVTSGFTGTPAEAIAHAKASKPFPKVLLVLDVSASMGDNLGVVKALAKTAVDMLPDDGILGAVAFAEQQTVILPPTALTTENRTTAKDMINSMSLMSNTDIFGAVSCGLGLVPQMGLTEEPCMMLFVTDGLATVGHTGSRLLYEIAALNRHSKTIIHTVGLKMSPSNRLDTQVLTRLALSSNGAFHVITDPGQLGECLGAVLAHHWLTTAVGVSLSVTSPALHRWMERASNLRLPLDEPLLVPFFVAGQTGTPVSIRVAFGATDYEDIIITVPLEEGDDATANCVVLRAQIMNRNPRMLMHHLHRAGEYEVRFPDEHEAYLAPALALQSGERMDEDARASMMVSMRTGVAPVRSPLPMSRTGATRALGELSMTTMSSHYPTEEDSMHGDPDGWNGRPISRRPRSDANSKEEERLLQVVREMIMRKKPRQS
jgi:Mg-chelatase subunit ChlD